MFCGVVFLPVLDVGSAQMKVLVTGGAGFIGSAVIRYFINSTNHSVVNLDKLTYAGNLKSLETIDFSERYVFEQVDICDAVNVERVLLSHQPDLVMHLAAESHVDRSIEEPGAFIQTNLVGTYTLLQQAKKYWHKLKGAKKSSFRFHHISTDEVYGDILTGRTKETYPYNPSSPYAASKAFEAA